MRWLIPCLFLPLSLCATKPPVVVPTPTTMHVHVHVRQADHPDVGIAGAQVRLQVPAGWAEGVTAGADGYAMLTVPIALTETQLQIDAEGYQPVNQHADVSPEITLVVAMQPMFVPLPKLVPVGQFFRQSTGDGDSARFTAIEASDFNLLNRWQHGEDITPVLKQRAEIGFNLLRVWTLYDLAAASIGVFLDPDYDRIPAFLDLCARYGFYVEFTAYTSTERTDHWNRLVAAVQGKTNVLLELVNEEDQSANHLVYLSEYQRPSGVLASHGSNGSEKWSVAPYWDYVTFHTNGASQEQRKVGHNAMEIWSGPTLANETSRYPEVGLWRGKTLAQQQALAFDSAAGAALLAAGSCFHSVDGKASVLFDANTEAVARAWVAGAKSVDLACQAGPYKHRADLEGTTYLRVYERPVAGHACVVRIRK